MVLGAAMPHPPCPRYNLHVGALCASHKVCMGRRCSTIYSPARCAGSDTGGGGCPADGLLWHIAGQVRLACACARRGLLRCCLLPPEGAEEGMWLILSCTLLGQRRARGLGLGG